MKVIIELTEDSDIKIYMQAVKMYLAIEEFAGYLRNQDKYSDNDVTEVREKFHEILRENEVSLG